MTTIAHPFTISGIGLHSGMPISVTVAPATAGKGRYFVYGANQLEAHPRAVVASQLSTELRTKDLAVRTVEHLLSALFASGVEDACITFSQASVSSDPTSTVQVEVPILDGSALPWVEAIQGVGLADGANGSPTLLDLTETITVHQGDSFVTAIPAPNLRFTYGIDFPGSIIGEQWFSWAPKITEFAAAFAQDIAPARTFTLAQYIEPMRAQGLIKGGSLDNAIVCDGMKWVTPDLRFSNEPCRHKLLDLIGDLSLLGFLPKAHILAYKASHHLHTEFAQRLLTSVGR
jgi:UDP-3-O-[3-hydroxymyristoyl] N-acetylglucosamine deacetylase